MGSKPYIVLLGDVGTGKSTIFEKLTGEKGRSSAASQSATLAEEIFEADDGSLLIADTPGSNSMNNQFKHNLSIAFAMKNTPVTCVLIVAKADIRIDNVIQQITKYAQGFIPENFPIELVSVCVTHMDLVTWTEDDMLEHLSNELGIETAVFSSLNTSGETLKHDLLAECAEKNPVEVKLDDEVILSTFDLHSRDSKVMYDARKQVELFEKMKEDYYLHVKNSQYSEQLQISLLFEFQQCLVDEIPEAQRRLSENNEFNAVEGPQMASEAGHLAYMTDQISEVLKSIRDEADDHLMSIETTFRQCPYCSTVWQNMDDCRGAKRCGYAHVINHGIVEGGIKKMSKFTFIWNHSCERLEIQQSETDINSHFGCGNSIVWSQMAPIVGPVEYTIHKNPTWQALDIIKIPINFVTKAANFLLGNTTQNDSVTKESGIERQVSIIHEHTSQLIEFVRQVCFQGRVGGNPATKASAECNQNQTAETNKTSRLNEQAKQTDCDLGKGLNMCSPVQLLPMCGSNSLGPIPALPSQECTLTSLESGEIADNKSPNENGNGNRDLGFSRKTTLWEQCQDTQAPSSFADNDNGENSQKSRFDKDTFGTRDIDEQMINIEKLLNSNVAQSGTVVEHQDVSHSEGSKGDVQCNAGIEKGNFGMTEYQHTELDEKPLLHLSHFDEQRNKDETNENLKPCHPDKTNSNIHEENLVKKATDEPIETLNFEKAVKNRTGEYSEYKQALLCHSDKLATESETNSLCIAQLPQKTQSGHFSNTCFQNDNENKIADSPSQVESKAVIHKSKCCTVV